MEALSIMLKHYHDDHIMFSALLALLISVLLVSVIKLYISKSQPVYLVNFSCLKPPDYCRVPIAGFLEHIRLFDFLDEDSVDFMSKIVSFSGQGNETYYPPSLFYIPPVPTDREAMEEVHMVLFPVFEDLLSKTKLKPRDIDIIIVNCSGFCPEPSLSSIIINKYKMREDVKSYTLTGMGCSASAIAVDMAKNILNTRRNSNAVILSTEILSTGWYQGKEKEKLIINCMFRMGSAAVLLSNKKALKKNSKYKLLFSLRTQTASDDKAYYSAMREEDSEGFTGVTVKKESLQAFAEAVRSHLVILGSSILPLVEKLRYALCVLRKCMIDKSTEIYVPDFKSVVQHFCFPTTGKPMLRKVGKELKLGEGDMEASLMTLHRFGNQSSSSLWYVLAYMEAKENVKKGDKVWQLGLGSGYKCISLLWECVGPIVGEAQTGPWADCISRYPVVPSSSM